MTETSLAQQLRKLAAPQTSLFKEERIRASFLFDPKEAASLDRDTVYAIGLTGLEELITINETFASFHDALFSENAKYMERSVQSKEVNRELDETLQDFFDLLSPYFLLRPAHKVIEWLVYRFHVHMYNVESFIGCILPFHETRHFARAIQLFDLSDAAGHWHWLKPLQKPGVPLPKSTLITHAGKNLGFLKFVCNLPTLQSKMHDSSTSLRPVLGFYTSTIVGVLEFSDVSDKMIALLLPSILNGLKSEKTDYVASTYLVLVQLIRRAQLEKQFLMKVIREIAESMQEDFIQEGLLCLLMIYQYQQINILPKKVFPTLLKYPFLVDSLEDLCRQHYSKPLMKPLVQQLFNSTLKKVAKGQKAKKLTVVFSLIPLILNDKDLAAFSVSSFFKQYLKYFDKAKNDDDCLQCFVNHSSSILKKLRERVPDAIDKELKQLLQDSSNRLKVRELTRSTILGTENVLVSGTGETLFLALNHADASSRTLAVKELVRKIKNDENLDSTFVKDSLTNRLKDNDPSVVLVVLKLGNRLRDFVNFDELIVILFRIMFKVEGQWDWKKVHISALKLLCTDFLTDLSPSQQIELLLSHILPSKKYDVQFLKIIMKYAAKSNPLLKYINDGVLEDSKTDLLSTVLTALKKAVADMEDEKISELLKSVKEIYTRSSRYSFARISLFFSYILDTVLLKGQETLQISILETALFIFRTIACKKLHACKKTSTWEEAFPSCLTSLKCDKIPNVCLTLGLETLIQWVKPVTTLNEEPSWCTQDSNISHKILLLQDLLSLLLNLTSTLKIKNGNELLSKFFKFQASSLKQQLNFMSNLYVSHLDNLTYDLTLQMRSLLISAYLVEVAEEKSDWILTVSSQIFPSILLSLTSDKHTVRKAALLCIQKVQEACKSSRVVYSGLADLVLKHKDEIIMDGEQLAEVICKWCRTSSHSKNLLVHLNKPGTPAFIHLGIWQLFEKVFSSDILLVAIKQLQLYVTKESCEKLSDIERKVVEICFSKVIGESVDKNVDINALMELFEKGLTVKKETSEVSALLLPALKSVSKKLVQNLPEWAQVRLLDLLLDLSICKINQKPVIKALGKVCSEGGVIAQELKKVTASSPAKTLKEMKRMKLNKAEDNDSLDSHVWKRIIVLLEVLQNKSKVADLPSVIPPLFDLLKRSLEMYGEYSAESVEYLRQCVLSCLQAHASLETFNNQQHQVSLLVKCLRLSQNPQTQHHTLVLLNTAAQLFPEDVLHNITSVFTFMGANLLRQDDNYSFQVVVQTVETVIPALLQTCSEDTGEQELNDTVAKVTRVFVDAFLDIPEHRRLQVLQKLVSTLGASKFLWIFLVQLVDLYVTEIEHDSGTKEMALSDLIMEFGLTICCQYSPDIQLTACISLLNFLSHLPATPDKTKNQYEHVEIYDLRRCTLKQLLRFRYSVASFIVSLLSSSNFLAIVAELDHESCTKLEPLYEKCLSITLQFIQKVMTWFQQDQSLLSKPWLALVGKLHDIIDKVNSLLPSSQFIIVIENLLNHSFPSVRRKAIEMLIGKLALKEQYFQQEDNEALVKLVKRLSHCALGKWSFSEDLVNLLCNDEVILNRQTALLGIKLLCRAVGKDGTEAFMKVFDVVIKLIGSEGLHPVLVGGALLCLAELCQTFPLDSIPYLSRFMPPFIVLLNQKEKSDMVVAGLVTCLQYLIENLAPFLSSYLPVILTQVCYLCDEKKVLASGAGSISQRLSIICTQIGQLVPPRIIVPVIEQAFTNIGNSISVGHLMSVFRSALSFIDKNELQNHLPQIQNLILLLLDYRHQHLDLSVEDQNQVEDYIVEAVMALVVKLSEVTFRPFFFKIYSWATVLEEEHKIRVITFYHLTERLSEALKSLFVLFAGTFIKHAATTLDELNVSKTEELYLDSLQGDISHHMSGPLLCWIINTLGNCFQYGGSAFVTKEHSSVIITPLVDQIENELGGDDKIQDRVERYLAPCIAYLFVGCDEVARKELNQKVLFKTRNTSAKVRFATLTVYREMVRKLGDDYMIYFAESVSFLHELMEDESTEVEELCKEVILEMEQILGEPLMKNFQ